MRSLQTGHPLNTSSLLPGAVFVQLNFWPFRNSNLILVLSLQSVHGFQDVRDHSAIIHLFIKQICWGLPGARAMVGAGVIACATITGALPQAACS